MESGQGALVHVLAVNKCDESIAPTLLKTEKKDVSKQEIAISSLAQVINFKI